MPRFCTYRANHKSTVTTHEFTHGGEKPLKCDFCGYRTSRRAYLNIHLRRHRENPEMYPVTVGIPGLAQLAPEYQGEGGAMGIVYDDSDVPVGQDGEGGPAGAAAAAAVGSLTGPQAGGGMVLGVAVPGPGGGGRGTVDTELMPPPEPTTV